MYIYTYINYIVLAIEPFLGPCYRLLAYYLQAEGTPPGQAAGDLACVYIHSCLFFNCSFFWKDAYIFRFILVSLSLSVSLYI